MGLTQIRHYDGSAWKRRGWSDIMPPQTVGGMTRPTGAGYVRYEDLYQPGDTMQQTLNRLTTKSVITFPEGEFVMTGLANANAALSDSSPGMTLPKIARGLVGSGPGTMNGSTGTVFTLPAGVTTGTQPTTTTPYHQIHSTNPRDTSSGNEPMSFGQFQVKGTPQNASGGGELLYNGFIVYGPSGDVDVFDVLQYGHFGNNSFPPGETFGVSVHMTGTPWKCTFRRINTDPRRTIGGPIVGGPGGTIMGAIGAEMYDCTFRSPTLAACFTIYRCFGFTTYDVQFGAADMAIPTKPNAILNTEVFGRRTDIAGSKGVVHYRPKFLHNDSGGLLHIAASTNNYATTYSGIPVSAVDGKCDIVDPTFSQRQGDQYLRIQSWPDGIDGDVNGPSSITTAPNVWTGAIDGAFKPYRYYRPNNVNALVITSKDSSF